MLLHLAVVALVADALALLLCVLCGARGDPRDPRDPREPRPLLIGVANPVYRATSEPGTPTPRALCGCRRSLDSGALTMPLMLGSGTLGSDSSFELLPSQWGDSVLDLIDR